MSRRLIRPTGITQSGPTGGAGCIGTSFFPRLRCRRKRQELLGARTRACHDRAAQRALCRPSTDISRACCRVVSCGYRVCSCPIQGSPSCGTSGISRVGSGIGRGRRTRRYACAAASLLSQQSVARLGYFREPSGRLAAQEVRVDVDRRPGLTTKVFIGSILVCTRQSGSSGSVRARSVTGFRSVERELGAKYLLRSGHEY